MRTKREVAALRGRWWIAAAALVAAAALPAALVSSAPPSRLAYAQKCAQEMGVTPVFNCMQGTIIPITKNGQDLTQASRGEDCDNPIQLGLAGDSQCVPYARFLRVQTSVPTVETAVICRKYAVNDNGPTDPYFSDIAVVQHNKATGNTCFYQSLIEANLDGRGVPSPQDTSTRGTAYWAEPQLLGPAGVRCPKCHDADPFVWSKYIIQVANVNNWNKDGFWNSNYQGMFPSTVTTFKPAGNACTACHRIGNQTCKRADLGDGRVTTAEVAHQFWMPPGFADTKQAWNTSFAASVDQIHDECCKAVPAAACNAKKATAEPDADNDFVVDSNDNCPAVANTAQANADGDQHGDACDNCPRLSGASQADGDGDGRGDICDNCRTVANADQLNTDGADDGGDACDTDDDNDSCPDKTDDKPKQSSSVIGHRVAPACPSKWQEVHGWDGEDSDGDGKRNCHDDDDDGDKIPDATDPCPVIAAPKVCSYPPVSCPVQKYSNACRLGGCNQLLLRIVSVVNPAVIVQNVRVQEEVLVLLPSAAQPIEAIEAAVLGEAQAPAAVLERSAATAAGAVRERRAPAAATADPKRRHRRTLRLELWSKDASGKPVTRVATVAEYDPLTVERAASTGRGALLLAVAGAPAAAGDARGGARISTRQASAPVEVAAVPAPIPTPAPRPR